jgi:hypothetical protein
MLSYSLCLLALGADRRSLPLFLLLTDNLHQQCSHNLGGERDGSRTDITPNMYADGSKRGARKGHNPFNVVREPGLGKREDRRFRVPELQEDLQPVRAQPAGDLDSPVKGGFLCGERLVCGERRVSAVQSTR